jgi:hypothetical protein
LLLIRSDLAYNDHHQCRICYIMLVVSTNKRTSPTTRKFRPLIHKFIHFVISIKVFFNKAINIFQSYNRPHLKSELRAVYMHTHTAAIFRPFHSIFSSLPALLPCLQPYTHKIRDHHKKFMEIYCLVIFSSIAIYFHSANCED